MLTKVIMLAVLSLTRNAYYTDIFLQCHDGDRDNALLSVAFGLTLSMPSMCVVNESGSGDLQRSVECLNVGPLPIRYSRSLDFLSQDLQICSMPTLLLTVTAV